MRILGIETSCDETGMAIYDSALGLVANVVHSQIATHATYGGVVPELAARDHLQQLIPVLEDALGLAKLTPAQLDGIAYTRGPGLMGALLVGSSFAKALSYTWGIPAIGVHHLEGHLLAPMLENTNSPPLPFIALLVSGGHTMLLKITAIGHYQPIGDTLDDAVGEAFDKVAKLLELGYPGGPLIEQLAKTGDPNKYKFPRPMTDRATLDFSFSGLKTAALHAYRQSRQTAADKANVARAFQDAALDTLGLKCHLALTTHRINTLVVAGGVGANLALRQLLTDKLQNIGANVYFPQPEFCTDNGAMIAFAGYQHLKAKQCDADLTINVKPRWQITDIYR